eukprot:4232808-Prymnesium_polylepis.1
MSDRVQPWPQPARHPETRRQTRSRSGPAAPEREGPRLRIAGSAKGPSAIGCLAASEAPAQAARFAAAAARPVRSCHQ